jgi:hypothetical protein
MRKSKRGSVLLCIALLAGVSMLTGCGEEPWELTDDEQDIIVNYAAHIVAKYNVKEPEGYTYVYPVEEEEEDTEEPETADTDDTQAAEAENGDEGQEPSQDAADEETATEQASAVSLSEALGLTDIQAVYTGAEITDQYDSVIPESGKELMILHVTLQNSTGEEQPCNLMDDLPVFRATVNGTVETTSELTILTQNLATWEAPIAAGASEDAVILFQVDAGSITQVEKLQVEVSSGGKTSTVVFL